jgi:MFS family permease
VIGFLLFLYLRPKKEEGINNTASVGASYAEIFKQKTFLLYLIPWIMFCVINFSAGSFFGNDSKDWIQLGEFGIGGISALVGGYFSDIIGRKRLIIPAFVMVGIGYALLSLSSTSNIALYSYVALDGIAWGIFMLMFFLVIWGDIAEDARKNKYYFLGNLPFILATYITSLTSPLAAGGTLIASTAFSISSFFLFIAVIPLVYAPETLPEKTIKERALKSYAEIAQKLKQKQT